MTGSIAGRCEESKMDDIQVWGFSSDVVNAVLSIAAVVLPILSALIVTALVGAQALPAFRKLVRSGRVYVDQPTDDMVVALAKALRVDPAWLSKKLTEGLDEMGKEPVAPLAPANMPLLPPAPETRAPDAPVEAVP